MLSIKLIRPLIRIPNKQSLNRTYTTSPTTSSSLLKNKRCIITGASRGIGAAIAHRFASEGASCILIGRNEELLQEVKSQLSVLQSSGDVNEREGHKIIVGDISQATFWDELRKNEKNIHILINSAGTTHSSPLFTTSLSTLQSNIATNLMGTLYGCRAIGKAMMRSKQGGVIVNVASLLGVKGGRGSVGYAASKAGVVGLTRALAAEVGSKGIRVNALLPGYVETDMTRAMTPEARSTALDSIPEGRFGTPSEVADAAFFLATNAYANNCVLNLDGGLSAV